MWEINTGYLKLTEMNELLQTFRVNYKILEPLLKVMMTVGKFFEKDNQNDKNDKLGKDLSKLLLRIIHDTDVDES
jgi:hypothetical protein